MKPEKSPMKCWRVTLVYIFIYLFIYKVCDNLIQSYLTEPLCWSALEKHPREQGHLSTASGNAGGADAVLRDKKSPWSPKIWHWDRHLGNEEWWPCRAGNPGLHFLNLWQVCEGREGWGVNEDWVRELAGTHMEKSWVPALLNRSPECVPWTRQTDSEPSTLVCVCLISKCSSATKCDCGARFAAYTLIFVHWIIIHNCWVKSLSSLQPMGRVHILFIHGTSLVIEVTWYCFCSSLDEWNFSKRVTSSSK